MKLIPPNITPGPWHPQLGEGSPGLRSYGVGSKNTLLHAQSKRREGSVAVCGFENSQGIEPEAEANARAIAATPDTLAALAFVAKYAAMKEAKGDPLPSQLTGAVRAALLKAGYTITE